MNVESLIGGSDSQSGQSDLLVTSFSPLGGACPSEDIVIGFSETIQKQGGSIYLKDRLTGSTLSTLSVASATASGSTLTWSGVSLNPGTMYDVVIPEGIVSTDRQDSTSTVCGVTSTTVAADNVVNVDASYGFSVAEALEFVRLNYCPAVSGNADLITNIQLRFNKSISPAATSGCFVSIFEGGQLHQRIDINADFESDGYHSVYSFSGNTLTLNPTKPLRPGKSYTVVIPSATLKDSCDVVFGGITTPAFETDGIEQVLPNAPTFGSVYIDLEFKRPVVAGYGKLNIVDSTGKLLTQLAPNDPVIKYSKEPF